MIEQLNGLQETVHYAPQTQMRLYINHEDESYPAHWHVPIEILWITGGQYTAICEQHTYHLQTGDLLLICPGAVHRLFPCGAGERVILQADCGPLRTLQEINTVLALMTPALHLTKAVVPHLHERACRLLQEIRNEYEARRAVCESMMYARLLELLASIGREWNFGQPDVRKRALPSHREKMLMACDYIRAHCLEAPSLECVAGYVGFSKFHFDRLFKQFVGMSYCRYLNHERIAYAESLLIDPDITITQTAMRCGFSSSTAFSRAFRAVKHCSPTEYRRMQVG